MALGQKKAAKAELRAEDFPGGLVWLMLTLFNFDLMLSYLAALHQEEAAIGWELSQIKIRFCVGPATALLQNCC